MYPPHALPQLQPLAGSRRCWLAATAGPLARASVLVGPHGAGLAALLFLPAGGSALELRQDHRHAGSRPCPAQPVLHLLSVLTHLPPSPCPMTNLDFFLSTCAVLGLIGSILS